MWKELKRQLRLLFAFSVSERRGVLLLLVLLALTLIVYVTMPLWVSPQKELLLLADSAMHQMQIRKDTTADEKGYPLRNTQANDVHQSSDLTVLFPFDPNTLSDADGEKLGFSKRQMQNIQHYLRAGGHFRKKTDLLKLYSIDEAFFDKMEAYILLPDSVSLAGNENKKEYQPRAAFESRPKPALDLNSADSAQLISLKGIGPSFARRILKYRNQLGGFIKPEQLMEVWGFTDSLLKLVQPQVYVRTEVIQKIKINSATVEQLKNHPYIWRFNIARAIINYRDQHGPYRSVEDLSKVVLVSDSTISQIQPYIDFE
ncbi:MAG: helix-hairpin-helix domain-containing protein [Bacteroidia bacterium]|nr:helix-hairpin-helix domain-containing protein [Bacteroidia bacterium]